MTWSYFCCELCDEEVNIGSYLADDEDEYTEYEITVTCGECVRQRLGIPSRYEGRQTNAVMMEEFKTRVMNEGVDNVIDYRIVYESRLHDVVKWTVDLWKEKSNPRYLEAIWGLLKTLPSNGLMVVAE